MQALKWQNAFFLIQVHSLSPWSSPILTLFPNEYLLKLMKFKESSRGLDGGGRRYKRDKR